MDYISRLPDSIRNHIVSLLPMEEAFRTSVLSKQWKHICDDLSSLVFDQMLFETKKANFKDCVDRIIRKHDGSSVDQFMLRVVADDSSATHINSWLSWAVQHNVEEIVLSVSSGVLSSLTSCLFSCRTLTFLHLGNVKLNLPDEFGLPILQGLDLHQIEFKDDNQINQLISKCPLLELLPIVGCSWNNAKVLNIDSLSLTDLILVPLSEGHDVDISCSNLRKLIYIGNPPDISLDTLSSLSCAKFKFHYSIRTMDEKPQNRHACNVSKILMGLHSVVQLELGTNFLEILTGDKDQLLYHPTPFYRLKYLSLHIRSTERQVQFVSFLLKIYPNLQVLSIRFEGIVNEEYEAERINEERYPLPKNLCTDGTLKFLKTVEVKGFTGNDNQLYLMGILFENATILEKVEIAYSDELIKDEAKQISIREQFDKLARASPNATISFVEV